MAHLKAGIYLEKFGYKSYFTCIKLQIWSFTDSSLGIRRDRLCQIEKLPIQTHLFNFKAGKIFKSECFKHCLLGLSITTKHQFAWFTFTRGVHLIVFDYFVIKWLMEVYYIRIYSRILCWYVLYIDRRAVKEARPLPITDKAFLLDFFLEWKPGKVNVIIIYLTKFLCLNKIYQKMEQSILRSYL